MIGQRQALDLLHEERAEVEHQPLADVGADQRGRQALQLAQRGDGEQQPDRHRERGSGAGAGRRERPQQRRERPRAQHGIDHDLERHRRQQRDRTGEQAEREHAHDVRPIRPCLAQYASVQRDVVHQRCSPRSRATASRTVAMAAVDCSSTRHAKNPAPSPNTAAATHARSWTAP